MNNRILKISLVIGFTVFLSACGSGTPTPTRAPTEAPPAETEVATEEATVEETESATEEPTVVDGATEAPDEATEESATSEAVSEGTTVTTNFPNANARSGPGTAYETLGPLPVGTTLSVVARTEDTDVWYLVELEDGELGWLWGRTVDLNPPDAEVEVAATIPPTPEG